MFLKSKGSMILVCCIDTHGASKKVTWPCRRNHFENHLKNIKKRAETEIANKRVLVQTKYAIFFYKLGSKHLGITL
jgi:hypothetical protein